MLFVQPNLSMFKESIKQVINYVCRENLDSEAISHLLGIALHTYIKCQNDSPPDRASKGEGERYGEREGGKL